jgi:dephospho-CoA kinase
MKFCVGLTGGIGSGKSTVAKLFAQHGAGIIDTDVISHHLTQPGGDAMKAIQDIFGENYITAEGALDRAKMRSFIFHDTHAKQRLEQLLHPLILSQVCTLLQQPQTNPYILLTVPLLPDAPEFIQLVNRILVVDCSEQGQIERVMKRSNMTLSEVRSIIAQQTPREERLQIADDVIHNDGDISSLAGQVRILHEQYSQSGN